MIVLMDTENVERSSRPHCEEEDDWSSGKNKADRVARWVESKLEWQKTRATSAQLKKPYELPPPFLNHQSATAETRPDHTLNTYDPYPSTIAGKMISPQTAGLKSEGIHLAVKHADTQMSITKYNSQIPSMPSIVQSQRISSDFSSLHATSDSQIENLQVKPGIFFADCNSDSESENGDTLDCEDTLNAQGNMSKSTNGGFNSPQIVKSRIPVRIGSRLQTRISPTPIIIKVSTKFIWLNSQHRNDFVSVFVFHCHLV